MAAAFAVCHYSAEKRKQKNGDLPAERVEPKIDGGVGQAVDEPRLRHQLHPGADAGCAGAHPHQAEIAVFKRPEDAVQEQCSVWLTALWSQARGFCRSIRWTRLPSRSLKKTSR